MLEHFQENEYRGHCTLQTSIMWIIPLSVFSPEHPSLPAKCMFTSEKLQWLHFIQGANQAKSEPLQLHLWFLRCHWRLTYPHLFFYLRENMKHYTQRLPNNAPGKTSTTSKLNWKYAVESRGTGSTLTFSHRYITVLWHCVHCVLT